MRQPINLTLEITTPFRCLYTALTCMQVIKEEMAHSPCMVKGERKTMASKRRWSEEPRTRRSDGRIHARATATTLEKLTREDEQLAAVQSRVDAAMGEADASAGDRASLLGEPEPCAGRSRASTPAEFGGLPAAAPCRPRNWVDRRPSCSAGRGTRPSFSSCACAGTRRWRRR